MNLAYKNRKYSVVNYDPNWVKVFLEESKKLKSIFGDLAIGIEHIGSTSVPGMDGKPTTDILVLVEDINSAEQVKEKMENAGYLYAGQFVMENSRLYRKMNDDTLLENIHIFPLEHPHGKEMLNLRNYLRSHPEEVKAYSKIKRELFERYSTDYSEYRKHKDAYMHDLLKRALLYKPDKS